METIVFNLNGRDIAIESDPSLRLVDLFRDKLGLTGTKEGCGEGECGACTILMDGKPVNSCLILAAQVKGSSIITIEGLQQGEDLHPIQQAFVDVGAVQCGYCTPGMILSAKALLDAIPSPNKEDVQRAISGNLCRCTGYKKIEEAILLASKTNPKP